MADLIRTDAVVKGVDFLPSGPTPPNPTELLMSDRLHQLMQQLRQMYDHIIIDSTPMFSVADASIVNRESDITIFVLRAGVQNRDFLPDFERMYQEHRFNNLTVVVNDVNVDKRYGYDYGYGYGYGYGQNKKKSRVKRIINRLHK